MRNFVITIDGKQYQVGVEEVGATPSQVTPVVTEVKPVQAAAPAVTNGTKVNAPMPGMIKQLSKEEGATVKKGDILMAMTDMKNNVAILGNTAIMPIDNEYIVNQRVGHLRANGYKGITYPFIYLLTNSTDFLINLRSRANSGVQVNLSSAEIKASQTVLPSEKVNTAFSEITLPMFEAIISNQLENQRLAQLRDTLLPKLMSGELDVSDIDL